MGSVVMVVLAPRLDDPPCVGHAQEPVLVETLVAQAPVEALGVGVLDGLPAVDEAQRHPPLMCPLVERLPGQLWPVVQDDLSRSPPLGDDPVQDPDYACARQARVHLDRQRLPCVGVDHREDPDPSPGDNRVADEIQGPVLVRPVGGPWPPKAWGSDPFASPPPQGEPFLPVEPFDAFVVDRHPFPPQQDVQPPVPEARPLCRELMNAAEERCRVAPRPRLVAQGRAMQTHQGAGAALRIAVVLACVGDGRPLGGGRQEFFRRSSFRI